MGGGDSVCVCVYLLDRVAALACLKVALCSSLLFVKLLVSLVGRGEDRGKEGEDRGRRAGRGGEKRRRKERGGTRQKDKLREGGSNRLNSLTNILLYWSMQLTYFM